VAAEVFSYGLSVASGHEPGDDLPLTLKVHLEQIDLHTVENEAHRNAHLPLVDLMLPVLPAVCITGKGAESASIADDWRRSCSHSVAPMRRCRWSHP